MPVQNKPIIHGRDHCHGGADPIPCLPPSPAGGTYTDAVLAVESLWAYWPLQDASGDPVEVVAGRDLTPIETGGYTLTYQQPGPVDGVAIEFAGVDSGVADAGTKARYDFVTGDDTALYGSDGFTIELWFWAATPAIPTQTGGPDYNGVLASQSPNGTTTSSWQLCLDDTGNLLFVVGGTVSSSGPSGAALVLSAVPNIPEQWVHVAVVYDGTTANLYVDGGLADSGTATFGGAGRFQIGRQATNAALDGQYSRYFEGRIAHVALYTGATDVSGHAGFVSGGAPGDILTLDDDGNQAWLPPVAGPDGVPTGGTAGQVLTKDTGTDYDTSWQTLDPANDPTVWLPLTTVTGGVPELVWDANDDLIPTLVPL